MPKKRLLFISLGHVYGGAEIYLLRLIALLDGCADIYVVAAHPELLRKLSGLPVHVIRFPFIVGPLRGLRWLLALMAAPFWIIRHRIDAVQVNGFTEILMLLPTRLLQRKAFATRHLGFAIEAAHWHQDPAKFAANAIYSACARFADAVVCVSHAVAAEVALAAPGSRVVTIPNWAPLIPAFKPREDAAGQPLRLLFVGRLEKRKGLDVLLRAVVGLDGVALTVVGDGARGSELRAMAAHLPVEFAGKQANPERFYEEADVFVMPTLGPEGMPLVSLEAMAHGLPCILSDIEVHREMTGNGECALLFAARDATDLREKILLLASQPELRARIARKAHAQVLARYSPEAARKAYMELFGLGVLER